MAHTLLSIQSSSTERSELSIDVPVLFALSISLFVLFYLWSRHLERNTSYPPIIKPSMFTRHRGRISATCASAFFACMSMYMFMFATALFYQDYMGLSAWENAVRILPINIAGTMAAVSAFASSRAARRPPSDRCCIVSLLSGVMPLCVGGDAADIFRPR